MLKRSRIEVPLIPECSACIINSLMIMIPMLSDDKEGQFEIYTFALRRLEQGYRERKDPLTLSVELYRELYTRAGNDDPYKDIKKKSNAAALRALPAVEETISKYSGYDRLRACLAAAIAGNVIDFNTAGHEPDLEKLGATFHSILDEGFAIDDSGALWERLMSEKGRISVLADNAGETIFDIPFLRLLNDLDWTVTYIVKGKAMINDATREDVSGTEIENLARVITTGAWAHGVPLKWVSEEFLEEIRNSDLVISKGQANIESLPEIQEKIPVQAFYLTRAKCPHISKVIGAKKGDSVVMQWPKPSE